MRGRVSAINYLFVGSSNTLGDFEAGAVAGWLGAVNSVLIGGIGSLIVAGVWMGLFPDLRHLDRFLGLVADRGGRIRQEFPPDCLPMVDGKMRFGIADYIAA